MYKTSADTQLQRVINMTFVAGQYIPGQNIPDKIYRTKRTRTNYTGQYIPDKIYRTKYTGQNKPDKTYPDKTYPGQYVPDKMYRTKCTGQNIPDKIYRRKKNTLSIADQLHVRMTEIATCCCDGIDDLRKQ